MRTLRLAALVVAVLLAVSSLRAEDDAAKRLPLAVLESAAPGDWWALSGTVEESSGNGQTWTHPVTIRFEVKSVEANDVTIEATLVQLDGWSVSTRWQGRKAAKGGKKKTVEKKLPKKEAPALDAFLELVPDGVLVGIGEKDGEAAQAKTSDETRKVGDKEVASKKLACRRDLAHQWTNETTLSFATEGKAPRLLALRVVRSPTRDAAPGFAGSVLDAAVSGYGSGAKADFGQDPAKAEPASPKEK